MFTKHLWKTIAGFCGMILFGLVSLVIIDNYKAEQPAKAPPVYAGTEDISEGSISAPKGQSLTTSNHEVRLLPYHEALGIYANRTIGIDSQCQMVPNQMIFKNNTKVMIDNPSPHLRTLKIGKNVTTVKGYGFKIINLYNSKLPVKLMVDCDTSKGVATILLEK